MAYAEVSELKDFLSSNYSDSITDKLTADGYVDDAGTFDEDTFLARFLERAASIIDDYVGGGPFVSNGVLTRVNLAIALYYVKMYIKAANDEETVSITIYQDYQNAYKDLERMRKGEIQVTPEDEADEELNYLIEPDNDGVTLNVGDLEETIFMGGSADATELPE